MPGHKIIDCSDHTSPSRVESFGRSDRVLRGKDSRTQSDFIASAERSVDLDRQVFGLEGEACAAYLPPFPATRPVGSWRSFPLTAAGQSRICTGFPFQTPRRHLMRSATKLAPSQKVFHHDVVSLPRGRDGGRDDQYVQGNPIRERTRWLLLLLFVIDRRSRQASRS